MHSFYFPRHMLALVISLVIHLVTRLCMICVFLEMNFIENPSTNKPCYLILTRAQVQSHEPEQVNPDFIYLNRMHRKA